MQNVLDHGYVKLIESWGSDERIVESARMSTDGAFRGWGPTHGVECPRRNGTADTCECSAPGDEKLLRFLYKHKHFTLFEMAGFTIEVQAPIFVFREWHRHRTQSYNELSARYTPLPDLYYQPTPERLTLTSATNKQAGTVAEANTDLQTGWIDELSRLYLEVERHYQNGLAFGVPKEVARIIMPVGHYSRMRASANLRNWLAFMTLRCDPSAQWEIRQYAHEVAKIVEQKFPRVHALWVGTK